MTEYNITIIYPYILLIYFNLRIIVGFFSVYKPNLKKDFLDNIVVVSFFVGYSSFLNLAIYQFSIFLSNSFNALLAVVILFTALEVGFRLTKYLTLKRYGSEIIDKKFGYFCEVFVYPSGAVIVLTAIVLSLLNLLG